LSLPMIQPRNFFLPRHFWSPQFVFFGSAASPREEGQPLFCLCLSTVLLARFCPNHRLRLSTRKPDSFSGQAAFLSCSPLTNRCCLRLPLLNGPGFPLDFTLPKHCLFSLVMTRCEKRTPVQSSASAPNFLTVTFPLSESVI